MRVECREKGRTPERGRPDFLCLGGPRTGSTWLYSNLGQHPGIYLPPVKELRYFNEVELDSALSIRARLSRDGGWRSASYRKFLRQRLAHYTRNPFRIALEWDRLRWDTRYLLGERSDVWYRSLFDAAEGRLSGELTPQYLFGLPEATIESISARFPYLKLVLFFREPIEWCWSFARMVVVGKRSLDEVPDSEILASFDQRIRRCKYVDALERWQRHFPAENIFVGFHDAVCESPIELYSDLCCFLDLDPDDAPRAVSDQLDVPVNPGRPAEIPERFAIYLARHWHDEIERMCEIFEPYPQRWLAKCIQISNGSTGGGDDGAYPTDSDHLTVASN